MRVKLGGASYSGSQMTVFSIFVQCGQKLVLRFESHHSYSLFIAQLDFIKA